MMLMDTELKTLDLVMLVDDNDTDNFISKRIIEITKFSNRVEVKSSGKGALDYLKEHESEAENLPSIIFLDINMPVVDGFVFLYEFEKFNDVTLFDLLMSETKPEHVAYEMDVFWVVFPNQNPAKLFEKYSKRWELVHLKDMKKGLALGSLSGGTDVKNDVTLGTGQLNWGEILPAAAKAGVKYYFIEDESPISEEQIPVSLKFLEQVKF